MQDGQPTQWTTVSRDNLCPICEHDHRCRITTDGSRVCCYHPDKVVNDAIGVRRTPGTDRTGVPVLHVQMTGEAGQAAQSASPARASSDDLEWVEEAEYLYDDGNGQYLHKRVKRVATNAAGERQKQFWSYWRTDNLSTEWTVCSSKKGQKGPEQLYRRGKVLATAAASQVIWVAEGEKCADLLAAMGLCATTSPGGAGKWLKQHTQDLKGASQVILVPDYDVPGFRHVNLVGTELVKAGLKVYVLDLPYDEQFEESHGPGIDDWFEEHASPADFLELISGSVRKFAPRDRPTKAFEVQDVCLNDVVETEPTWLWRGRIALGTITVIAGIGGVGKSFLTAGIAAKVTRGLSFLDEPEARRSPALAVFLASEDDLSFVLKRRFRLMEADMTKVRYITGKKMQGADEDGKPEDITLFDVDELERYFARTKPTLVVLDPIQTYLIGDGDINKSSTVRKSLDIFSRLAKDFNFAGVAVSHLSKGTKDFSLHRIQGSQEFSAAVRSVLFVGNDPQDKATKAVAHAKCNFGAEMPTVTYTLKDGRFAWGNASELSTEDILTPSVAANALRQPRDEAMAFLRECLADGPVKSGVVYARGKKEGHIEKTLLRAAKELGVVVTQGRTATWSLPAEINEESRPPLTMNVGDLL